MKCVIMRGCSGAGKTTYIEKNMPDGTIVISADHFWLDPVTGEYKFDPKRLGDAHAWALRRFVYEVRTATDPETVIVVDNTNTTPAEYAPYYAIAAAHGFDTELVTLDVPHTIGAARNVHSVPANVVQRQYQNLMEGSKSIPSYWNHKIIKGKDN